MMGSLGRTPVALRKIKEFFEVISLESKAF